MHKQLKIHLEWWETDIAVYLPSDAVLERFSAGILLQWRSYMGPQWFPGQIVLLPREADPNSAAPMFLNLRLYSCPRRENRQTMSGQQKMIYFCCFDDKEGSKLNKTDI